MILDKNDADAGNKTTKRMEARDLHLHVLDLVLPADWQRVTPQIWTKDHDSLETYEARIGGHTVQVELKSDQLWVGRFEAENGAPVETGRYKRQPDVVRALAEAIALH